MLAADLLNLGPVIGRWVDDATSALNWFADECGDIVCSNFENFFFQCMCCPETELLGAHIPSVSVPVGFHDVLEARKHG